MSEPEAPAERDEDLRLGDLAARRVSLAELERLYAGVVLARLGARKGRAAAVLGIDPKTLYRKRKAWEAAEAAAAPPGDD